MFTVKHKKSFRTLSGLMALIMLILPATTYSRGHKAKGSASSDKQQIAPLDIKLSNGAGGATHDEKTERVVSMPQNVAEPQQRPDIANRQGRGEEFKIDRESSKPLMMRLNGRRAGTENKSIVANERFDTGINVRAAQEILDDNRPQREKSSNRIQTRAPLDMKLSKGVEKGTPISSDNHLRAFSKAGERDGTFEKEHNNIGMMRTKSKIPDREVQRSDEDNRARGTEAIDAHTTAPTGAMAAAPDTWDTQTKFSVRTGDDSRFRWKGRDTRAQRETNRRGDRDNVTLRVVNSVPASLTAQRTPFSRGTRIINNNFNHKRIVDIPRNDFVFFGRRHHFMHHRIIRPDFFFLAYFDFGPWYTFCPVYPYYHVRYIFVNPCGYWPHGYSYVRYYRYGCYPYYWYGYNPVPYEYGGNTYNYYTYNYYGSDTTGPASGSTVQSLPDYSAQQPAAETSADKYFDAGVKAFGEDDYKTAVAKFALARQLAPDDKVLLFAYSQAYFATGDYKAAAQVLRAALAKVNPVTEGVFYPRGLYSSDDILLKQIDDLSVQANQNEQDADLQLLLGYQWLGIGELDKAVEPLQNASPDSMNGPSAKALQQLLDKLQTAQEQMQAQTPNDETPEESD